MQPQFENYLKKVDNIFRFIGMSLDKEDSNRSLLNRLKYHWKFSMHLFAFNFSIVGQIVWMVLGIVTGKSLLQITYLLPCITVCLLGNFRVSFFIYYIENINDLINSLKTLEINGPKTESTEVACEVWLKFLTNVSKMLLYLTIFGVATFIMGPFVTMASYYYSSGEIKLILPFILWYPFDELDIHFWPFVYIQQTQAAWVAINAVVGPDCFFFTCCTFIHLQFLILQQDLEQIVKDANEEFKPKIVNIVNRHLELIRCVELLNNVYSKSILFNVATSSLIICASGFNVKFFDNYVLMVPFVAVLVFGMMQVSLYCFYGDYVMRSSMQVGDAIYNSHWYDAGVPIRKYLLIILIRSQKPCKFTAYGFTDVNLMTFTRILSSSWSYFALLNQMYYN